MDNFEKHLRKHKEAYDLEEVNPAIWENIHSATPVTATQRPIYARSWRLAAAAVILLLGSYALWPKEPPVKLSADLLYEYGFNAPDPHLVISARADELAALTIPKAYAAEYKEMLQALQELDQRYAPVLKDLKRTNAEEHTQRQALSYYRKKADLLNKLIQTLLKLQHNEKQYPNAGESRGSLL